MRGDSLLVGDSRGESSPPSPTGHEGITPREGWALGDGGQRSISLEYQIKPPPTYKIWYSSNWNGAGRCYTVEVKEEMSEGWEGATVQKNESEENLKSKKDSAHLCYFGIWRPVVRRRSKMLSCCYVIAQNYPLRSSYLFFRRRSTSPL